MSHQISIIIFFLVHLSVMEEITAAVKNVY